MCKAVNSVHAAVDEVIEQLRHTLAVVFHLFGLTPALEPEPEPEPEPDAESM